MSEDRQGSNGRPTGKDSAVFRVVRRDFLKTAVAAGGIKVIFRSLAPPVLAAPEANVQVPWWSGPPGKARFRIDGIPKVTGQKIYARDFRSRDMPGWPANERCALVLRCPVANKRLESINLNVLPPELQPIAVVKGEDLNRDKIIFPGSDETINGVAGLVVAVGQAAEFLGQPAAILIFENFSVFRRARRILQFNRDVLTFGGPVMLQALPRPATVTTAVPRVAYKAQLLRHAQRETRAMPALMPMAPLSGPSYVPPTYVTRYADSTGEKFSQTKDGWTNPYSPETPADQKAAHWRTVINDDLNSKGWKIFKDSYETQELDPLFMEPESGLGWFDKKSATLHLVLGTQSPDVSILDAVDMFSEQGCPFDVKTIELNSCYPGGGFGGRDISTFPTLISIAAAYADGPVRMAYDRFEQFQSGLKQLGGRMEETLAIDSDGRFQALVAVYRMHAGGRNNYGQWVAQLAGYCSGGGYVIPRVSIDALAESSIGVIAGSMRGFGGPQAAFALESLIDEAAKTLSVDPIELRERNALAQGGYTVTGYQVQQSLRLAEICRMARANPLWITREEAKKQHAASGTLFGVGFALANLAYGTGGDGVIAAVELDAAGKIRVTTNAVDMGNGSATSLAISTAGWLGANASDIQMGDPAPFAALNLSSDPPTGPKDWSNPRWTPVFSGSSSASMTACQQVHAVEAASQALVEIAIWPAACELWKLPGGQAWDPKRVSWNSGALVLPGQSPLPLSLIAAHLHGNGAVAGAMVHAFNQGRWVAARYPVGGQTWHGEVDGLATWSAGTRTWTAHDRQDVEPPPPNAANYGRSLFAPSGTLAAVMVDPSRGDVKVLAIEGFVEAGRVIQPDMVMGQFYGGVAMGIGFALLEYLPHTVGGAGEGNWNMNRYHPATWHDVPLNHMQLHILEPLSPDEPGRGIAEAVMTPVAAAIANAVAHATGVRFHQLPITPASVLEALHK